MSDDTLSMLADAAAAFAKPDPKRVRALRGDATGFDPALWREMAAQGWLSILVPESEGGLGLGLQAVARIASQIGRAGWPEPFVAAGVMPALCLASGGEALGGGKPLQALMTGELVAALAWQDERGGLDTRSPGIHAQAQGSGWRLSGRARFVRPAAAQAFVVAAQSSQGLVLVWLDRDHEGVRIATELAADESFSASLMLDGVVCASEQVIATGAKAQGLLDDAFAAGLIACSAQLEGLMAQALEMTLEYLRTRKQFGRAIGSFQSLQHRAVDLWIQHQLTRATVTASARSFDAPTSTPASRLLAATSAKARASQAALQLCNQAVQLHGAIGFTDDYDLGLYVNRALVLSAWLGNAAEHRRRFDAIDTAARSTR